MTEIARVAFLSLHTSPLAVLGTGDAGGMNVVLRSLAAALGRRGIPVDVYTRRTDAAQPAEVALADGVTVRHISACPPSELAKENLHRCVAEFTSGVAFTAEAAGIDYTVVHSHYWLSGQAGVALKQRWERPLAVSFHTLGRVKNANLADGQQPEPLARLAGEDAVIEVADCIMASTTEEADDLLDHYGADPGRLCILAPGVDHAIFRPGSKTAARAALGWSSEEAHLLFVGRLQPLKAPDVAIRAVAALPAARLHVVGGPSGRAGNEFAASLVGLAEELGAADRVQFEPAVEQAELAARYQAADLTLVPSYTESFGLVALESAACGTPVAAAPAGGLAALVRDGVVSVLVPSRAPAAWADVLGGLLGDPDTLAALGAKAADAAAGYSWDATAARVEELYSGIVAADPTPIRGPGPAALEGAGS